MLLGLLLWIGAADNEVTNAPYVGWKHGLVPYRYSGAMHYLGVDQEFRASLQGKTLPQLHRWFPVLVSPSRGSLHQKKYAFEMHLTDRNARWIGQTDWVFRFRHGRVDQIALYKG